MTFQEIRDLIKINYWISTDALKPGEFQQVDGMAIVKNNRLVFENYYGGDMNRMEARSIGTSGLLVTLAALGVAIDQRVLSMEDSIYKHLPEYLSYFQADDNKLGIRIQDLVTHRTGINWNENIEPPLIFGNGALVPNPANNLNQMKNSDDWVAFVLSRTSVGLGFYSFNTANGCCWPELFKMLPARTLTNMFSSNYLTRWTSRSSALKVTPLGTTMGVTGTDSPYLITPNLASFFCKKVCGRDVRYSIPILSTTHCRGNFNFHKRAFNNSIGYFWIFYGEDFQGSLGVDYTNIAYLRGELNQMIIIAPDEEMVVAILSENYNRFGFQSVNLFSEITRAISR